MNMNKNKITAQQQQKDSSPQTCITAVAINVVSRYPLKVQEIHCRSSNTIILWSENIKQTLYNDWNEKSWYLSKMMKEDSIGKDVTDPHD